MSYRPTFTPADMNWGERYGSGLNAMVQNLLSIQERKAERERRDRAERRQAELDRMDQEERARRARVEEDLYKIKLGDIIASAAGQAPTPTTDLGQVPPTTGAVTSPEEKAFVEAQGEPTAAESAAQIQPLAGQAPIDLGQAPVPIGERQYEATLSSGQKYKIPLKSQEEKTKEEEEGLKRKLEYNATVEAARIKNAAAQKKVVAKIPLGDRVLIIFADGTERVEDVGEKPGAGGAGGAAGGVLIPVTNAAGNITGFYNNRTGAFSPAGALPEGARRSGVPSAEMTQRGQLETVISDAEKLKELASGEAGKVIGPVSGTWAGLTRGVVGAPREVQDLFHIADNLAEMLLRARSGAQINEAEYARLRKLVPNPRDEKGKFDADLDRFLIESRNILSARQGGAVTQEPTAGSSSPIVQRNKRTGEVRHSLDGGKTWLPGPPQ